MPLLESLAILGGLKYLDERQKRKELERHLDEARKGNDGYDRICEKCAKYQSENLWLMFYTEAECLLFDVCDECNPHDCSCCPKRIECEEWNDNRPDEE